MGLIEDEIQDLAVGNLIAALKEDAVILDLGGMLSESRVRTNREVIGNATYVLEWLNSLGEPPTCPYLDSLDDEQDFQEDEEEFCECGCGDEEDYPEPPLEQFSRTVKFGDLADFHPELSTYLIFCKG